LASGRRGSVGGAGGSNALVGGWAGGDFAKEEVAEVPRRVGGVGGVVADVGVQIPALGVGEGARDVVRLEEAGEGGSVEAVVHVVVAGLEVALVAGEAVGEVGLVSERRQFHAEGFVVVAVEDLPLGVQDYPRAAQVVGDVVPHDRVGKGRGGGGGEFLEGVGISVRRRAFVRIGLYFVRPFT